VYQQARVKAQAPAHAASALHTMFSPERASSPPPRPARAAPAEAALAFGGILGTAEPMAWQPQEQAQALPGRPADGGQAQAQPQAGADAFGALLGSFEGAAQEAEAAGPGGGDEWEEEEL
jgi:hypothetical protein